jgi:hypothetical protein
MEHLITLGLRTYRAEKKLTLAFETSKDLRSPVQDCREKLGSGKSFA